VELKMTNRPSTELLSGDETAPISGFPSEVDAVTFAALLGLSRNRVNALAKAGNLPRTIVAGVIRFPIPAAVHAYVEYAKANPVGRRVADPDLAHEKKRLAKEQADKIGLANAITREELVPLEDVRREWRGLALDLRARLLAIGPRVAAAVGLDRTTAASLDTELRAALEDIADDH
jgi:phage terminase Nu1 subunit (DNA packaging protein)